jgi:hypothetical protein
MYAYPFVYACFCYWLGFNQKTWIKTERTAET